MSGLERGGDLVGVELHDVETGRGDDDVGIEVTVVRSVPVGRSNAAAKKAEAAFNVSLACRTDTTVGLDLPQALRNDSVR